MAETTVKTRLVRVAKLQSMSDEELRARVTESAAKIERKRGRYEAQHKENLARLDAYIAYRKMDTEFCQKLLNDRAKEKQQASSLPIGNNPKGNVVPSKVA